MNDVMTQAWLSSERNALKTIRKDF